jgi:hypothetical protein
MPSTLTYPTGGDYREALYNTKLCFKDHALIGGNVTMDNLGMPKPISGGSGSVFTIESVKGQRWAVKCFTRFVDHQSIRYQRISEVLQTVNKPWRVGFEYLNDGILSQGIWYPALKMEWVDAIGLISFVEKNLLEPARLSDLAVKFARMVGDLSTLGIAHGDLQHGNLLVTSSGELKLIDYDGMFVPSLTQMGACETGHINYQSPARTMSTWGPYLDNFSAWIIYTSLLALSIDPALWVLLHDQGDEALLFNHADFANQQNSRALLAFAQSSRPDLQALANAMSNLWTPDIRAIPYLDPTALPVPGKHSGAHGPILPTTGMTSANAASRTLPDWITQNRTGPQAKAPGDQGDISWITGHLPRLPLVAFHPSRTSLRLLLSLALAVIIAIGICAETAVVSALIAGITACVVVCAFITTAALLFRRTAEWRAKHEKFASFKKCKAESSKAARKVSEFQRARYAVDSRERKSIEKITKEAEKAKESELKELADLDKSLTAKLRNLEKQQHRLQTSETNETAHALRAYQQQHITNYLNNTSISSAKIHGIGQGVVTSLATYGIRNAADFTGLQLQVGPRGGQQVRIVRRDGISVHPSGVGEKKAQDLENWRRGVERAAIATQPSSLPVAQAQAIRSRYAQRRNALADQERIARTQAANDQSQVKQKWASTHVSISAKLAPTRQAFAQERAQADLHLSTAQKEVSAATMRRQLAERELSAYRKVSYRRYLTGAIRA